MSAEKRTGPGMQKGRALTPEQIAANLEHLARGRAMRKPPTPKDLGVLASELVGMPLDEIRKHCTNRQWVAATMHLGGYEPTAIGRALGYSDRHVVAKVLKHPVTRAIIDRIQTAQMQRIIDGEFGVQAAAKAAAPRVMKRVIEKTGAVEDQHGNPVRMAQRDADQLRASEMVMRISGDLVEKTQNVHMHLMSQLEPAELDALAFSGQWPERYKHILGTLDLDAETPKALDVTPER